MPEECGEECGEECRLGVRVGGGGVLREWGVSWGVSVGGGGKLVISSSVG